MDAKRSLFKAVPLPKENSESSDEELLGALAFDLRSCYTFEMKL